MNSLLVWLVAIPLLGAIVGAFVPARQARYWALVVSLATLVVGLVLAAQYYRAPRAQGADLTLAFVPTATESPLVLESLGVKFSLGMDAISFWLVLLTVVLTPSAILFSFASIREREKEYYAWMLLLLSAMLGVFVARDLLLFYVFFELTLVPMFFIIGIWGGPEKRYAAGKFFLFTFTGSVFTLAAVIYLGLHAGPAGVPSFDLKHVTDFAQTRLSDTARLWIVLGFLAGFAVKVPLFPVHTWLPLAHTEAPTAGSVILAGVLLKLGTYGLLRLAVPLGFVASTGIVFPVLIQCIGALCVIGIIYGALVAWVQEDIKKLVAYSSVSHLGFCILGLMAFNDIGMQGSVMYMINHGISTGAMFLVIGMIYDRYHTRNINELSGLARVMPRLAFFFIFFTLSSIGLPGTNGFVSEFLTVLGAFTSDKLGIAFGVLAALGVILGAVYMLYMASRVIWGPLKVPGHGADEHDRHEGTTDHAASEPRRLPVDIGGREVGLLIPLALAVIVLGVAPTPVLRTLLQPLQALRQPIGGRATATVDPKPQVVAQVQASDVK
jgi:NADH-quinone oxidoreductase subunit M